MVSTLGKSFPKSLTCVKDKGGLFSLTLILIVLPEIKKLWFLSKLSCFLRISPGNMGISFYRWITCFDQSSQYPPSSFFASLSWYRKPGGSPSFAKTWKWLWGSFYWFCGKFQCFQSGYYILAFQKRLPLSSSKNLLPLYWESLLCPDIPVWNTVSLTSTDVLY